MKNNQNISKRPKHSPDVIPHVHFIQPILKTARNAKLIKD